jgi:hypothetical protein
MMSAHGSIDGLGYPHQNTSLATIFNFVKGSAFDYSMDSKGLRKKKKKKLK